MRSRAAGAHTGDDGGVLRMWDVASLRCVRELSVAPGTSNGIQDMEQSACGSTLLLAGGRAASLIHVPSFSIQQQVLMDVDCETATLHPSRRYLLASRETYITLYDLAACSSAAAAAPVPAAAPARARPPPPTQSDAMSLTSPVTDAPPARL